MTSPQLRVLVANEREDRFGVVTELVARLGHTVVASSTDVTEVGALTTSAQPDVALVASGAAPRTRSR